MFLHGKIVSTSQAMGHSTRDSASAVAQAFLVQWQESQATEGEPPKFIDGMAKKDLDGILKWLK